MATISLRYKNNRIGVVSFHGQSHLFIEGEHISAVATQKNKGFVSPHLPYQKFPDLGKAIVEYREMDRKKKER